MEMKETYPLLNEIPEEFKIIDDKEIEHKIREYYSIEINNNIAIFIEHK